jgi:hypothetical protein
MSTVIGRRDFLAGSSVTLAAATLPTVLRLRASIEPVEQLGLLDDWTIDDMWGVYPRYADPIGFGRVPPEPRPAVAAEDEGFVA